uniref:Uncharacterized protein n=1 Tax=Corvus moneduloides TaxID=1196302 RepID=A0A8U7MQK9_CORMO
MDNVWLIPSGAPMQRARYKRMRCRPDAWSANCIEEKGPWFYMPSGGANRILPPMHPRMSTIPALTRYQELGDIFPLSDEDSASGSNTMVEAEPASGSGLGDNDSFSEAKLPVFLESLAVPPLPLLPSKNKGLGGGINFICGLKVPS